VRYWLRVVVPPSWVIAGLAIGWVPYLLLLAVWLSVAGPPVDPEVHKMGVATLGLVAVMYGFYRVTRFHPVSRPGYRDWLARTPWTPAQPLPDGPVLLAWQDVVVLAILGVPAWLVFGRLAWPLFPAFALPYLLVFASCLRTTGPREFAYAVGFGLAGMVLVAHVPLAVVGIAGLTYLVAAAGFRRSLDRFPWPPGEADAARGRVFEAGQSGWPFDRLAPVVAPPLLRPWEAPVIGLLIGFGLFAVGFQLDRIEPGVRGDRPSEMLLPFVPFIVTLAAFVRLAFYMIGHLPPISLWGRLATGRLIIPRYDAVFVAPVLAVVVGVAGPLAFALPGLRAYAYVGAAVGTGLAFAILLTLGPDRTAWRLTAPARLVPVGKKPAEPRAPLPALALRR
jgi:hypothetical protein